MKLKYIAVIIAAFVILSLLLSVVGIISTTISEILSYSLIITGIYFVYSESVKENIILIFIGSEVFLAGTYFLIVDYFNLQMSEEMIVPMILISTGSGLFIVYITVKVKKIFLIVSILLLSVGITFLLVQSHFKPGSFLQSVLPVLNFLWPVFIIAALIILLVRSK